MKYFLVPVFFALISLFILCNRAPWRTASVIRWDASGYYMFLPAVFVYHDLDNLRSTDSVRYRYAWDVNNYGITPGAHNNKRTDKYPLGVALMELPFFCFAHYIMGPILHKHGDGFGPLYQIAVSLASIFWVSLGLFFLGMLLARFYNYTVVTITLLVIAFGTNLYDFTVFDPGWSHPFSFFLYCCIMYYSDAWRRGQQSSLVIMGFLLGMLVITRPVNIVAILIPLLWPRDAGMKKTLRKPFKDTHLLWAGLIAFLLPLLLQASYWRYTTGQWIYYSYGDEGFNFRHPYIWEGLFSYRKGWFIYTPAAFVMVCGIPLLRNKNGRLFMLCTIFTVAYVYIVFSWRIWHYGGSFSSRPMIDILPLLSLPLAAVTAAAMYKRIFIRIMLSTLFIVLITLNLFQTYQYSTGILHCDRMSRAYYWRIFGQLRVTAGDRKLLLTDKEAPYVPN